MEERAACALLKARFEAAGFQIQENKPFAEAGVAFEIDGYDPERRVGYEFVSEEAGDTWDVDTVVIGKLDAAAISGDVHIFIIRDKDAPDAETLNAKADEFLAKLVVAAPEANIEPQPAVETLVEDGEEMVDPVANEAMPASEQPATRPPPKAPAAKKPAAKRPAAKKPAVKKPAAKKPAAKKPAVKKPAAKKPATKKPATKKPATKRPVAKKPAAKKPVAKKR